MNDSLGPTIYNEFDGHACEWLRNLVTAGHISRGRVLEQDIRELAPADVMHARRFHAFAGIGLWDYALELASWPAELPVWTGSCPCQPFSVAGRRRGTADERHLWPEWLRLICECRPAVLFGEQTASPDGRAWLDAVSSDLEGLGYAVGTADLCAAGVGAPHLRQRLFFVAHHQKLGRRERRALCGWGLHGVPTQGGGERSPDDGRSGELAHLPGPGLAKRQGERRHNAEEHTTAERHGDAGELGEPDVQRREGLGLRLQPGQPRQTDAEAPGPGTPCFVGHAGGAGSRRDSRAVPGPQGEGHRSRQEARPVPDEPEPAGHTRGFWADADWILCRDGKARPVEPGTFPLAHGHAGRMAVVRPKEPSGEETHWYNRAGALKCIGNAIVPQVAATFIEAFLDTIYRPHPSTVLGAEHQGERHEDE